MTNTNDNVKKVFKAFEDNPSAMNDLLKKDETEVIRGILGSANVSDEEVKEVTRQVNENNVMKLYLGADGQIDANQLLGMTGGFTSVERGKKTDAIGALLDGKLDIKDLLALITLMSGNHSSSSHSSGSGGLLSTLLGGSQQQQQVQQASPLSLFNSLISAAQPQQQTQHAPSLFSSLFGGSQQQQQQVQQQNSNAQLNALLQTLMAQQQAQQQQQQSQQQSMTMNQLLGTLLGQAQQQAQQQPQTSSNSLLGNLLGQAHSSQQQSGQTQNSAVLNAPLFTEAPAPGTAANNNALNQFLGQSATNSNGTVNVNSMFDLINILMGSKK